MKTRKLWLSLCAALLCAALLCGAFAVSAEELTDVELDIGADVTESGANDIVLDLDPDISASLDAIPGLDLDDPSFGLDGALIPEEVSDSAISDITLANDESADSGTDSDIEPVALKVRYDGPTLTKTYDGLVYAVYKKKNKDGTTEIVWTIGDWSEIRSYFKFSLANSGDKMVEGHSKPGYTVSFGRFDSPDVGEYNLDITFTLTGDDAPYYTLVNPTISVPAKILVKPITITPYAGLTKVYGDKDPVFAPGKVLFPSITDPESKLYVDISGVPYYGVPHFTNDDLDTLTVLMRTAQNENRDMFPGWLSRKKGENAGKYRITIGDMDFGKNFKTTLSKEYFLITRRPLLDEKITLDSIPDKAYTGKTIKPKPVVKFAGKKLKAGVDYTVSYANNKNIGRATVTITGKGNFKGKRKIAFNILPNKTAISKLTSPAAGQIAVTWKKGSGITGYQVAYSLKKDFSDQAKKTVKGAGKTSLTFNGLSSRKTYYVRVRTYKVVGDKKYFSTWSKIKYIKTK